MRTIFILILIAIFSSCTRQHTNKALDEAYKLTETSPQEALDTLATIDYAQLSQADRHYYDFVSIKANDKAYVTHKSDSLILDVIDYYAKYDKEGIYPEVLYYGGRVYSDLGDYPTALKYFQQALDLLPEDTDNPKLRAKVLSQTGRLLTSLSLYDEAIPYIKSCLDIAKSNNDTINIIHEMQLLGGTYMRADSLSIAEQYFKGTLSYCAGLPASHSAKSRVYLAAIKFRQEQIDSAFILVRGTIDEVHPTVRNNALCWSSLIYKQVGLYDSSYIFAKDLISSEYPVNKDFGYQIILSPKLIKYSPEDSVLSYINRYADILKGFYDRNKMELTINRQNHYNYQMHVKEKENSEKQRLLWQRFGFVTILIIFILTILYLKLKLTMKSNIILLKQTIENLRLMKSKMDLEITTNEYDNENISQNCMPEVGSKNEEKLLRERLRNELLELYHSNRGKIDVSLDILNSEAYGNLQEIIAAEETVDENHHIWKEIECAVLKISPNFKKNFNLLTMGKFSPTDYNLALLIKIGIKPVHISKLFGRTNGAITSRRNLLCARVLNKKMKTEVINAVIRLM